MARRVRAVRTRRLASGEEDRARAQALAGELAQQGIKADVVDLSAKKDGESRPRNFDLVLGKE